METASTTTHGGLCAATLVCTLLMLLATPLTALVSAALGGKAWARQSCGWPEGRAFSGVGWVSLERERERERARERA